jgi:hypothetical protein
MAGRSYPLSTDCDIQSTGTDSRCLIPPSPETPAALAVPQTP